jgi:hypothetical protein
MAQPTAQAYWNLKRDIPTGSLSAVNKTHSSTAKSATCV